MIKKPLLLALLDRNIEDSQLCFKFKDYSFIVGHKEGSESIDVTIHVKNARFFRRTLAEGSLGLGECFMQGDFTVEKNQLSLFLEILLRNRLDIKVGRNLVAILYALSQRFVSQLYGKTHNVHHHYDVGNDLFKSFLGSQMVYSCGYAHKADDDIEALQKNKMERICRKLRLRRGENLIDIGCGFGGLLIYAAKNYGVQGIGITLSKKQYELAQTQMKKARVGDKVKIIVSDFKEVNGQFDKVVSVGMMEHVPRRQYRDYFQKFSRLLKPGGVGLLHTIGVNNKNNTHDPFIQKYIFPAGNQPRLSEITTWMEKKGLCILDVENMIRHYRLTALRWLEKFRANSKNLDPSRYDSVFKRMWEFYLSAGVAAATASDAALYQVLFTNDHTAPIPLHRI